MSDYDKLQDANANIHRSMSNDKSTELQCLTRFHCSMLSNRHVGLPLMPLTKQP